ATLRPYSTGGRLNALAAARKGLTPPTPSRHRLQRGLPGYLIPFAPHAFAPQRQELPRDPPSPPVFLPISTHFTATPGIPVSSAILKNSSIDRRSSVEPKDFTTDLPSRLRALYAQYFLATLAPSVLRRLLAQSWPGLPLQVPSDADGISVDTLLSH